jgi:hypothetical protein
MRTRVSPAAPRLCCVDPVVEIGKSTDVKTGWMKKKRFVAPKDLKAT